MAHNATDILEVEVATPAGSTNFISVKYPSGVHAYMQPVMEGGRRVLKHTGDDRFLALSDGTGIFHPSKKIIRRTFQDLRRRRG